jgi:hypothetical protein
MSESLKQLLQQADTAPSVSDPTELAHRVRRRRMTQLRRRRTMLTAAMVLLVTSVVVLWPKRNVTNVAIVESAGPSAASLEIDARVHALTADALLISERARRATAHAEAQPDPIAQVHFQRDRAAMTLVYEADRFVAQPHQTDLAIAQYRKVIQLFPDSSWADVARQRLRDIPS